MNKMPYVDPNIRHVSITQLRKEKEFTATLVVHDGPLPLAVVVPYATFLEMQNALQAAPPMLPPPGIPIPQGDTGAQTGQAKARQATDPSSPLRGV